jgi:hypothetical protein
MSGWQKRVSLYVDVPAAKRVRSDAWRSSVELCTGALTARFIEGDESAATDLLPIKEITRDMYVVARTCLDGYYCFSVTAKTTCQTCGKKKPAARLVWLRVMCPGGESLYCVACAEQSNGRPLSVDDLNEIDEHEKEYVVYRPDCP